MACKDYERLIADLESARKNWFLLANSANEGLRGGRTDGKAKQLAKVAEQHKIELIWRLDWHRASCAACKAARPLVEPRPAARVDGAGQPKSMSQGA